MCKTFAKSEIFRGTMLDVKSGLRNESDWLKK